MIYKFRKGSFYAGDPQEIGEELEKIRIENEGFLDPENVIDKAKNQTSVLHSIFEWNNTKAANEFRLWQARNLIGSIVVKYQDGTEDDMRYYISVRVPEMNERRYYPVDLAIKRQDLNEQLLESAYQDMQMFIKKYEHLRELARVLDVVRVTLQKHKSNKILQKN